MRNYFSTYIFCLPCNAKISLAPLLSILQKLAQQRKVIYEIVVRAIPLPYGDINAESSYFPLPRASVLLFRGHFILKANHSAANVDIAMRNTRRARGKERQRGSISKSCNRGSVS
jgi:hypothetical protein